MRQKKYKRLSFKERVQIELFIQEGRSKSYISNSLNRSRSTITREINKWVVNSVDRYDAELAHSNALDDYLNKRNLSKIDSYPRLKIYIYRGLLQGYSPELRPS